MQEIGIEELGREIKLRNKEAFRILYRNYFATLQQYAMRYLYDQDEAENLVQEAFFSLWEHIDKYDPEGSVYAYILGIVKNNCLKYIRGLKIRDSHKDKIIEALLFSNIREEEPDRDLLVRLNEILTHLSDKQREILLKHVVESKTIPQIASELQLAESTVKTHYKRAIAILRSNFRFILFGL